MESRGDAAGIVQLANEILSQIHVTTRVRCVEDITPSIFVLLFEGLCGEVLPDVKRHPRTREDAIHNSQVVIDTLSMDVLNTSLSHITGDAIVAGDHTAIANLLDVFSGLLEYMLDKIGSDASSVVSRARSEDFDDPDLVTPEIIDSILQSELSKDRRSVNSTDELIRLGQVSGGRDCSSADRTSLLMALGNSNANSQSRDSSQHLSRRLSPKGSGAERRSSPLREKVTLGKRNGKLNSSVSSGGSLPGAPSKHSPGMFDSLGVRPQYKPNSDPLSCSLPGNRRMYEDLMHQYHHEVDPLSASLPNAPYDDLESMVRHTVAMSRAAVAGSPLRQSERKEDETELLRSSLEKINLNDSQPKSILSPGRTRRVISQRRKAVTFKPKYHRVSDTSTDSSKMGSPAVKCRPKTSKPSSNDPPEPEMTNSAPQTFKDYLRKYYGNQHPRISAETATSLHSSSGHEADYETELNEYKDELLKKAKTVRFDDILDDSAPGRMGSLRRKLKAEDLKNRVQQQYLSKVYNEELKDYEEELWEDVAKQRMKANETNSEFRKKIQNPKPKRFKPGKKYSASVAKGEDLLPWLLEEFPFLHLSSETIHDLWRKSSRQVEQMSKAEKDTKLKRNKQQDQLLQAERKQQLLLNIMKKEVAHNQRMKEVEERRKQQQSVKASIREKRQASARSRKYYDEFQVRMRSKMLKKRNREEMLFKKLFEEGLDIQKDRIRELRKYAKDQREKRSEIQGNDLASLENYYKDQFSLLAESMAKERKELSIRENAQSKLLGSMKQELRKKMEREIRDFQDQLWRDEDDIYFRDLDAQRIRQELYSASYQAKV
ncbi:hypothetical protein CAPTEDRAFT_228536 [Capitella teleta]|uniref:DUF5745 domain-containing protein n=1 Tax=Capitella teleta TaxID=283909 RepID=R7UKT7_CAPTE|nr:hypothetical protein CAPTEDRAFT_228536 [Capitella teleta]|eukprot:ELU06850.1 hypothetical protein CAPTEDRAFT_228536 [Capitella teleta]